MKLSPLQVARYQYSPKLPGMLRNGISDICVCSGGATESVADQEKIKALFPNTYGKNEITFQKGKNTSAPKKQIVGVILSGGQAPGGHNVICGLYDALKACDKENVLYGFKGGPSGLLEDNYVVFDDEYINQYRNTGGFDIIGSGRTKLETEEQFAVAEGVCKKHGITAIVIIGGGVIGIEFATFYADLGCEVTVIEGMDRLLPNMDKELGQSLALILKKQGVKVFTNAMVQSVEKTGEDIAVNFICKEKSETVSGEAVLCAIGRRPYCDGLFADGISVEMNRRSIAVNERYETSIPHIYAIGDVSAKIQLAHVATAQGIACVDLLYGRENHTSMSVVPSCIYCRPEIAVVGLTEAEAKEAGIPVKVGKHVMFDNAKTLIADPGRCFMKFVAHAETRELLGAQLMCEHSSDMIGGVSQALANHMTVDQFLLAMRPHPSFEEAMTAALEDLAQKLG